MKRAVLYILFVSILTIAYQNEVIEKCPIAWYAIYILALPVLLLLLYSIVSGIFAILYPIVQVVDNICEKRIDKLIEGKYRKKA